VKQAKRKARGKGQPAVKPRNPLAIVSQLKRGGAHRRRDKRAARALLAARTRQDLANQDS